MITSHSGVNMCDGLQTKMSVYISSANTGKKHATAKYFSAAEKSERGYCNIIVILDQINILKHK